MPEKKFRIVEGVFSQTIGEETVLLDMNGEEYFGLNEVGTIIWKLLQDQNSIREIHQQLIKQFNHDPEAIRNDIEKLLADLMDAGLVEEYSGI